MGGKGSRTNLRRRDSVGLKRKVYAGKPDGSGKDSFAFPADATIARVLKNYTTLGKVVADAV
jgi:hypothetical protein